MASKDAFVFIDGYGKPFKVAAWGIETWCFYWHEHQKSWVSLRKLSSDEVNEFRKGALPAEHAKVYDDQHDKFARKK